MMRGVHRYEGTVSKLLAMASWPSSVRRSARRILKTTANRKVSGRSMNTSQTKQAEAHRCIPFAVIGGLFVDWLICITGPIAAWHPRASLNFSTVIFALIAALISAICVGVSLVAPKNQIPFDAAPWLIGVIVSKLTIIGLFSLVVLIPRAAMASLFHTLWSRLLPTEALLRASRSLKLAGFFLRVFPPVAPRCLYTGTKT